MIKLDLFLQRNLAFFFAALVAVFTIYVVVEAWVSDDAFITFRVIDNFIHGYGLRWNVDERVQVYTDPLWMFLHIPLYYFSGNIYLSTLALSFFFSAFALIILLWIFRREPLIALIVIFIPLLFSKSYIEFSTSGLENPLTAFLLAWFLLELTKERRSWFRISLIAALAGVNRFDTLLFYLPTFALLITYDHRLPERYVNWRKILLGFAPLFLWHSFSLFYYGFLFPNTKYAKLNTGISITSQVQQGFLYFFDFMMNDPQSFLVLVMGIFCSGFFCLKARRNKNIEYIKTAGLSLGLVAYCLYIVYIGGDFMSGRFFTGPIFLSVYLIALFMKAPPLKFIPAFLAIFFACFLAKPSLTEIYYKMPCNYDCGHGPYGIVYEKDYYIMSLLFNPNGLSYRNHDYYLWGQNDRKGAEQQGLAPIKYVKENRAIGMYGYAAGPNVIIVDNHALSDPLLARLPPVDTDNWRIGHFFRTSPAGYLNARRFNNPNLIESWFLREYYSPLRLITSGNLFDAERLKTIILFNLGDFDYFKQGYLNQTTQR